MKRFDNVKMVLFDSTNAYFKLAVEAQFTRKNPDGSYRDLVYTTDRGTSILNPNIYLTLSYKDDNMNAVYTSYPQLYLIRAAFERIKDMILDDNAYILAFVCTAGIEFIIIIMGFEITAQNTVFIFTYSVLRNKARIFGFLRNSG